jgi:protoporphyrinogen/coproporphyrinogen III oxidase
MNEPSRAPDVVIVGAGISGLSLGYFLKQRGLSVEIHEAQPLLGGNIRTAAHDGFLYDVGPDSFVRSKPDAELLCRELGLGEALVEPLPEGRQVYVAFEGALHPMPEGLALGVPTHPQALLESKLLSDVGKLRALCEPFVIGPERWPSDESIEEFLVRRLGREMTERIAAPLLSGVFAGDAGRLSVHAAFPQLPSFERRHGSLFFGMMAARNSEAKTWFEKLGLLLRALMPKAHQLPSPFYSLAGGLGQLVERLAKEFDVTSSARLFVDSPAKRLLISGDRVTGVVLRSGREVRASQVVVAGPPWTAAEVVGLGHPNLRRTLLKKRGAPTATVFFGLEAEQLEKTWHGSGFIVPRGEGEILASTWTHQKWGHRAPAGKALVRAFLGGARRVGPDILGASDEELIQTSRRELERFMGGLGPAIFTRVYRYARGTPQPELGHLEWAKSVRKLESELQGLSLIGPGYDGVGIPDCVRAARHLAQKLSEGVGAASAVLDSL